MTGTTHIMSNYMFFLEALQNRQRVIIATSWHPIRDQRESWSRQFSKFVQNMYDLNFTLSWHGSFCMGIQFKPRVKLQLTLNSFNIRSSPFFWPTIFKHIEALKILSTFSRLLFFYRAFFKQTKPLSIIVHFCYRQFWSKLKLTRLHYPTPFPLENKPQKADLWKYRPFFHKV